MERRKTKRYKVKAGAHVVNGPALQKVGQLVDVGPGGLAFHYLGDDKTLENYYQIGIRYEGGTLFLGNIAVKTVADFEVVYENPLRQIPLRRRCLRFGILAPHQIMELEEFILKQVALDPN